MLKLYVSPKSLSSDSNSLNTSLKSVTFSSSISSNSKNALLILSSTECESTTLSNSSSSEEKSSTSKSSSLSVESFICASSKAKPFLLSLSFTFSLTSKSVLICKSSKSADSVLFSLTLSSLISSLNSASAIKLSSRSTDTTGPVFLSLRFMFIITISSSILLVFTTSVSLSAFDSSDSFDSSVIFSSDGKFSSCLSSSMSSEICPKTSSTASSLS